MRNPQSGVEATSYGPTSAAVAGPPSPSPSAIDEPATVKIGGIAAVAGPAASSAAATNPDATMRLIADAQPRPTLHPCGRAPQRLAPLLLLKGKQRLELVEERLCQRGLRAIALGCRDLDRGSRLGGR